MTSNADKWIQGESRAVSVESEHVDDLTGWTATLFVKKHPTDYLTYLRREIPGPSVDKKSFRTEITADESAALPVGQLWLIVKLTNPAGTIAIESRERARLYQMGAFGVPA